MGYLDSIIADFNNDILESSSDIATDNFNYSVNNLPITEAEYKKAITHLELGILDINRFIQVNEIKQITNPVFYTRDNIPTSDGLMSNEIFGITKMDRSGKFGYIDLGGYYIDPSCYKNWAKIDSNIKNIVHHIGKYSVNKAGIIVEDEAGETGVKFLKKNIDKISFRRSNSIKRDLRVSYLELNRDMIFINKYPVIPPYYRDTNTGRRTVGVDGINKLYSQLLTSIASSKATQEFGFDLSGPMQGKIQEIILTIYDWACGNTAKSATTNEDLGIGIGGKQGILRRANLSKTTNYGARLVISAPELKTQTPDDMMVNFDRSAVPIASCVACFRPYIQYHVRHFFENEFVGKEQYPVIGKDQKIHYYTPKDPLIEFSDERIASEMEKFILAPNDRFIPIMVPIEETGTKVYMQFNGKSNINGTVYNRAMTWCDIFYIAAVEAVKDKMVLITRFPVDTRFNQITTKVIVSSTKDTDQVYVRGIYYPYYPKIRQEQIGKDTDNLFVDTLKMSNLYLPGLGGDYDGDTVSIKGVFTTEANVELMKFAKSKMNFIDLGANNVRASENNVLQALYEITKILNSDKEKITVPKFV